MVPRAAPASITALWARVEAPDSAAFAAALAHLEPALESVHSAFVTVRYAPLALTAASTALHAAFAARHPQVSTAVPFCLPGQPNFDRFGAFATPPDCAGCLFYEGRACAGLGHEALPWAALAPPTAALRGFALTSVTAADFTGARPVACWRPTRALMASIAAAMRAAGGRVVDLGGGNGFFSALLAAEGLDVTLVDVADGPTPAGVRRVVAPATAALGLDADAVFVSWPPTGNGFREAIEAIDPAVIALAADLDDGVRLCGRQPGHAGVVATAAGLRWYGWPRVDDAGPWPGRPLRASWRVPSYRTLCAGEPRADGVVELFSAEPLPGLADQGRYPWEPAPGVSHEP